MNQFRATKEKIHQAKIHNALESQEEKLHHHSGSLCDKKAKLNYNKKISLYKATIFLSYLKTLFQLNYNSTSK